VRSRDHKIGYIIESAHYTRGRFHRLGLAHSILYVSLASSSAGCKTVRNNYGSNFIYLVHSTHTHVCHNIYYKHCVPSADNRFLSPTRPPPPNHNEPDPLQIVRAKLLRRQALVTVIDETSVKLKHIIIKEIRVSNAKPAASDVYRIHLQIGTHVYYNSIAVVYR